MKSINKASSHLNTSDKSFEPGFRFLGLGEPFASGEDKKKKKDNNYFQLSLPLLLHRLLTKLHTEK